MNIKEDKSHVYIITLTLLLLVGAGGFFLKMYQLYTEKQPQQQQQEIPTRQHELEALYSQEAMPAAPEGADPRDYGLTEDAPEGAPDGFIFFSTVPVNTRALTQIYALDVTKQQSDAVSLIPDRARSGFAEFTDKDAPSDFFLNTIDENYADDADKDGTRIQELDAETGTFKTFTSATGTYEQSIAYAKESKRLAFNRLGVPFRSYTDLVPIRNWEVVITDPEKDTLLTVIPGAVQPKWSPDGEKLVYLKADGLYVYDLKNATETKVVTATEGQILATSKMDVSPDGKYLITTVAKAGIIIVSEITSWEPFTLKELGRIQGTGTEYYWPQFSYDSKYYVVQAIDAALPGSVDRLHPRFEIRPIMSRTIVQSIPIDAFNFEAFFTDTWVKSLPAIKKEGE
jgi:hypothetical protein